MKRKFYVIPGWQETCRRKQYQMLAQAVRGLGYEVVFKNVNWQEKLSKQLFVVEKDSILFGFSMGAILARLIAQKYKNELVILASMTPLKHFRESNQEKILAEVIGKQIVADVKKNLILKIKSKKIIIYGDKEGEKADILVPNTDHEISKNYIKTVLSILSKT